MANRKFGMLIDLSFCIGCNACVIACKMENEVPITKFNTWIESWDVEDGDYTRRAHLPKLCNHCENPACVHVCPTGASHTADNGTVQVDEDKCIGCKYCMAACPFGVRWMNEESGDVHKCTFCEHRTSHGMLTACTSNCVTGARIFGDLNDPESEISLRLAAASDSSVLLADMGMKPSVHYVGLDKAQSMKRVSAIHQGGNVKTPYEGRQ